MKESLTFDFCTLKFYDDYVVAIINEGINIDQIYNKKLIDVITKFFNDKPFVYITHRINSYSVDPHIYDNTASVKNLIGFAVVSNNYQAKINAQIEQMFFKKPFKIFASLDEAYQWANSLIKEA